MQMSSLVFGITRHSRDKKIQNAFTESRSSPSFAERKSLIDDDVQMEEEAKQSIITTSVNSTNEDWQYFDPPVEMFQDKNNSRTSGLAMLNFNNFNKHR